MDTGIPKAKETAHKGMNWRRRGIDISSSLNSIYRPDKAVPGWEIAHGTAEWPGRLW